MVCFIVLGVNDGPPGSLGSKAMRQGAVEITLTPARRRIYRTSISDPISLCSIAIDQGWILQIHIGAIVTSSASNPVFSPEEHWMVVRQAKSTPR